MRIRRIDYKAGEFSYAERIAVAQAFQSDKSEYYKMKDAWRELYGWNARLMPPKRRAKEFQLMTEGLAYWVKLEQENLHYEPTAEEKRAGIADYTQAVGDMGTIKALAKAYAQDPDTILRWEWSKVYGILVTDLQEFKFGEKLRKEYEKKH